MTKDTSIPQDAPVNEHGVPACPECGKFDFRARTALGMHRRTSHGVIGASKSAIEARRAKQGDTTPSPDSSDSKQHKGRPTVDETTCYVCEPPRKFAKLGGLRIHQAQVHNMPGKSSSAVSNAKAKRNSTELRKHHDSNVHSLAVPNHNHHNNDPQLTAEDLAVFQAVGEIRGLCRTIAEQAGIPTLLFTGRVVFALYSQTRRG